MMVPWVTTPVIDPDDLRLDDYRRLQDTTIRQQLETTGRFFIIEGWEAVRRLLSSGWDVRSILVTEDKADRLFDGLGDLGDRVGSFPRYVVSRHVASQVVGFDMHRGVIASAGRPEPRGWRAVATAASRLAILEGINDYENLGAIFRSAAALGIEGLLLGPSVPDPLYRRSVRVSMGAVLMVPFARVETWPGDLEVLKTIGFTLIALTPDPSAALIESVGHPPRTALLLGSEASGLSKSALAATHLQIRIGQSDGLDSLNVGHAAAIAFHHFRRR
jgi:tRNA G18 (ribose-2'-O)-methylase SpoU